MKIARALPSNRQHQSCDDCLKVKRKNNQNCFVLCCVQQLCTVICTHVNSLNLHVGLALHFVFMRLFRFNIFCVFCVSLDCFILVLLALLCWILLLQYQERLRNDLFCVKWNVTITSTQSISQCNKDRHYIQDERVT